METRVLGFRDVLSSSTTLTFDPEIIYFESVVAPKELIQDNG